LDPGLRREAEQALPLGLERAVMAILPAAQGSDGYIEFPRKLLLRQPLPLATKFDCGALLTYAQASSRVSRPRPKPHESLWNPPRNGRVNGIHEVRGSIPLSSTIFSTTYCADKPAAVRTCLFPVYSISAGTP
jgi:hypothetical protein